MTESERIANKLRIDDDPGRQRGQKCRDLQGPAKKRFQESNHGPLDERGGLFLISSAAPYRSFMRLDTITC